MAVLQGWQCISTEKKQANVYNLWIVDFKKSLTAKHLEANIKYVDFI